jgi:energy-coupling factor transporter ATP-binding protein EcfA2
MKENYIKSLELTNFTAFDKIDFEFSPGINVFIGANGMGKTHLLKTLYCMISLIYRNRVADEEVNILSKFIKVFLPDGPIFGHIIRRGENEAYVKFGLNGFNEVFELDIRERGVTVPGPSLFLLKDRLDRERSIVFVPTKEILSNSFGFVPLYEKRELYSEEMYYDILIHAYTPALKFKGDEPFYGFLDEIENVIGGKVKEKGGRFYLEDGRGHLEFTLLAEGFSKLGLLWLLINNGSIEPGCTLFWDEPETNLNPSLLRLVVKILLELQRHDVQIFVATHNYVLLKEFDLQMEEMDGVMFHSLYRDEKERSIKRKSTGNYLGIYPNVISETYLDIYEKGLRRNSEKKEPNRD